MDGRKKTFFSCFLFSAALFTAGCGSVTGYQQSKFQNSFLPPAPQAPPPAQGLPLQAPPAEGAAPTGQPGRGPGGGRWW